MSDFLFELGCEELPSLAVKQLSDALLEGMLKAFASQRISHGDAKAFATPRRLALWVKDVADQGLDHRETRKGPSVESSLDPAGKPLPALLGFAKSCGVGIEALGKLTTEKGSWWTYEAVSEGKKTVTMLAEMLHEVLAHLPIKKPMSWGEGGLLFARPVHWALLMFGGQRVDGQVMGMNTQDHSVGHRFHHPSKVQIHAADRYENALYEAYVMADYEKRKAFIRQQIMSLASTKSLTAVIPEDLLDEVTSIVEWPKALMASFDASFLQVPAEALVAAMQSHQKSFALMDAQGQLSEHFILVANIESQDESHLIQGNQKVMHARLSDAAFFFQQDKSKPLQELIDATKLVVYQKGLGSLADKTQRMAHLIASLVKPLHLDYEQALRAVMLSKCDLLTGMVGEFPELQGLMGYYYALNDQEPLIVAEALKTQYKPCFADDDLPNTTLGLALSLVDRVDTLVGLFALGLKPTGVKDPFKSRRNALAVIRLMMALNQPLSLSKLIDDSLSAYDFGDVSKSMQELKTFILERMSSYYQSHHIAQEVYQSVIAVESDVVSDIDKRVQAVAELLGNPETHGLYMMAKRVSNVLSQSSLDHVFVDRTKFTQSEESDLFDALEVVEKSITEDLLQKKYQAILMKTLALQDLVVGFFERVMVMGDDQAIKNNRLSLLTRLQTILRSVADLSQLTALK